jgi:hypothetical protein
MSSLHHVHVRVRGRTGEPTVASMPTTTTTRLKLCCVVRTAFSPGERSDHLTCPVSPVSVMLFRCGCGGCGGGGDGLGVELCVAWLVRVLANAARPTGARRVVHGCMRGSRKDGRSRAMASVGLYIAAMAAVRVNVDAREAWESCKCKCTCTCRCRCGEASGGACRRERRGPRHRGLQAAWHGFPFPGVAFATFGTANALHCIALPLPLPVDTCDLDSPSPLCLCSTSLSLSLPLSLFHPQASGTRWRGPHGVQQEEWPDGLLARHTHGCCRSTSAPSSLPSASRVSRLASCHSRLASICFLTRTTAVDSILCHPQPPLAPRPRSAAERRSTRQSLGRKSQTRRHTDGQAQRQSQRRL